jgi:hypothetical protein
VHVYHDLHLVGRLRLPRLDIVDVDATGWERYQIRLAGQLHSRPHLILELVLAFQPYLLASSKTLTP